MCHAFLQHANSLFFCGDVKTFKLHTNRYLKIATLCPYLMYIYRTICVIGTSQRHTVLNY